MFLFEYISFLFLLFFPSSIVVGQTTPSYTAYQTSFAYKSSCLSGQYYDIALLQCSDCPTNAIQSLTDQTQCDCINNTYYYGVNQGGGSLICTPCSSGYLRSTDGFGCTLYNSTCVTTVSSTVPYESNLDGNLNNNRLSNDQPRIANERCTACADGTWSDPSGQRCTPCASITPYIGQLPTSISCCATTSSYYKDGICLTNIINQLGNRSSANYNNRFNSPTVSAFFQQHLDASVYLCQMNLNSSTAQSPYRTLLSNVTACQVLANIATMQFYYPVTNYAFNLYNTYIWQPISQTWTSSSIQPAIPFLAYPSTYYQEITNSSYNWIPASSNPNDIIDIRLAKYSPTGQYLGIFEAFDSIIQLCGDGYTDGKPAFTFGTQFSKTCNIRADALWNSTLYETAFFDPYIVFIQNGTNYMLPTPVVIKNYQTAQGTTPNENDDESQWVYHRRFFLIDRISGVIANNELRNIHYAKSIKFLNTLTNGATYIQPPVIVIEYDELALTDIGKGTIIEISFETQYRMNLDAHISSIWIAIGVLSGLGLIFALIETSVWQTRAGKEIIDLETIGKYLLYVINILGTVFFIVMAGVSLWWLIFFKRQDSIYLVIPMSFQQQSFTALVVIAFVLKTLDIFHLIIRQSNIDIFFIDWEKSKKGNPNLVSAWRTYFVANEYSEIQTFRRINVTLQLILVLFLLKVINIENVATIQPSVTLFPSSAEYVPAYNGILRVGIAFSMWLATALVQYFVYILFYQRFVEDRIINFIDLCSVSNISVFFLMDKQYGYYIHGQAPHGTADINMKEMLDNLRQESKQTIGGRGLEKNSNDQTFIIRVDRPFRTQYDILLQSYQIKNRIHSHVGKKTDEHESDILLASYRNLNEFLCAFIQHALPIYDYTIRARLLLEKILNCEFRVGKLDGTSGQTESIFLIDTDRNFTKTLFSGYENSLFIWNMATFLFIDYFATNYILAAIITYLLHQIAARLRVSLGQKNLSKKTLIPKNFLI